MASLAAFGEAAKAIENKQFLKNINNREFIEDQLAEPSGRDNSRPRRTAILRCFGHYAVYQSIGHRDRTEINPRKNCIGGISTDKVIGALNIDPWKQRGL